MASWLFTPLLNLRSTTRSTRVGARFTNHILDHAAQWPSPRIKGELSVVKEAYQLLLVLSTMQTDLHNKVQRSAKPFHMSPHSIIFAGVLALAPGRSTKVAIKVVKPSTNVEAVRRVLNEKAALWARLEHRNIVPFFGLSPELGLDGIPAMVYQLSDNGNILRHLQQGYGADVTSKTRSGAALRLMSEVAQGLAYLHQRTPPVVHTDVRAANILIDSEGHARLTDIGLFLDEARFVDDNHSLGLSRWTSPEVLRQVRYLEAARAQGVRSAALQYETSADVYAFGMTMIEVFSGVPPFSHNDSWMLKKQAKGAKPPLPAHITANTVLLDLVDHCWDESPSVRPTMAHVASTLASECRSWKPF